MEIVSDAELLKALLLPRFLGDRLVAGSEYLPELWMSLEFWFNSKLVHKMHELRHIVESADDRRPGHLEPLWQAPFLGQLERVLGDVGLCGKATKNQFIEAPRPG